MKARFLLKLLLFVSISIGILFHAPVGESIAQVASDEQIYLTQPLPFPDGKILRVTELESTSLETLATGLGQPGIIACGDGEHLFVNDQEVSDTTNRIVRFDHQGENKVVVQQWSSSSLVPDALVFTPNGDLLFGTRSVERGDRTAGIWRIKSALEAEDQFEMPEQILDPATFQTPLGNTKYSTSSLAFLTSGPFEGDLLIKDVPSVANTAGGRILRAIAPDFTSVEEFIPAHRGTESGGHFQPAGAAVLSNGDVLITDFTNAKVKRYDAEGNFISTFAVLEFANQIAIDANDNVYVTNARFTSGGGFQGGGLHIYDSDGNLIQSTDLNLAIRGIAIC